MDEVELRRALSERYIDLDEVLEDNDHICTVFTGFAPGHIETWCGKPARYATSQLLVGVLHSPMGEWYCHYRCQEHLDRLLATPIKRG